MGGPGSRSYSSDPANRGQGRKPNMALSVRGTGVPEMPEGLPIEVRAVWRQLVEMTSGVTFSQDSIAILETARLILRQEAFHLALASDPTNSKLSNDSLSVGRQLMKMLEKLGLTPRDRQSLVVAREEEHQKKSRLQMIRDRQSGRGDN